MIQHFWPVWNMERKKRENKKGKPSNPTQVNAALAVTRSEIKPNLLSPILSQSQKLKIMRFKPFLSSGNHDGNLQHDVAI